MRGRFAEAHTQFLAAQNDDPASAVVSTNLSYVLYLRGHLDSALVVSEQALQGSALNYTAATNAAHALLEKGLRDSARAVVNRLTVMVPPRAYIMGATGDSARAWAQIRAMNRQLPDRTSFGEDDGSVPVAWRG